MTKYIKNEDLDKYLSDGWVDYRKYNITYNECKKIII